jgi:hypothetical protein
MNLIMVRQGNKMSKILWVVEVFYKGCWYPVVNPKLSREGGRTALKMWRINGSRNKYRLVQYGRIEK